MIHTVAQLVVAQAPDELSRGGGARLFFGWEQESGFLFNINAQIKVYVK